MPISKKQSLVNLTGLICFFVNKYFFTDRGDVTLYKDNHGVLYYLLKIKKEDFGGEIRNLTINDIGKLLGGRNIGVMWGAKDIKGNLNKYTGPDVLAFDEIFMVIPVESCGDCRFRATAQNIEDFTQWLRYDYNRMIEQVEYMFSEKEFVIHYYSLPSGKENVEVISAMDSDSAYKRFKTMYNQYKEGKDYKLGVIRENGGTEDIPYEPEPKMIYSDSLDEKVVEGFTVMDEYEGAKHYTWNDEDCVYYWDEADDDYYQEVPSYAKLDY